VRAIRNSFCQIHLRRETGPSSYRLPAANVLYANRAGFVPRFDLNVRADDRSKRKGLPQERKSEYIAGNRMIRSVERTQKFF
jgi:hypothetical protein